MPKTYHDWECSFTTKDDDFGDGVLLGLPHEKHFET